MVVVMLCFLSQVAMNDLSPAGPIQAVEILMESPSLADMCRMHHAVIRRIQVREVPRGCAAGPGDRGTLSKPRPGGAARHPRRVCVALPCGMPTQHGLASGRAGEGGPSRTPLPSRSLASAPGVWASYLSQERAPVSLAAEGSGAPTARGGWQPSQR